MPTTVSDDGTSKPAAHRWSWSPRSPEWGRPSDLRSRTPGNAPLDPLAGAHGCRPGEFEPVQNEAPGAKPWTKWKPGPGPPGTAAPPFAATVAPT